MKNPNRYGSISKLGGTRRRPYMVREGVTGRQEIIGYTATKQEAMQLLASYNKSPWNLTDAKMTVKEVIDLFFERKASKYAANTISNLRSASKNLHAVYNMQYTDVRAYHIQQTIDARSDSAAMQKWIRIMWRHLDDLAFELDIVSKTYASIVTVKAIEPTQVRRPFTHDEIAAVWTRQGDTSMDALLFMLYTGYRVSEMAVAKCSAVDINEMTITGGGKTAAGKNRIVPLHKKIQPIVMRHMECSKTGALFENLKHINSADAHKRLIKLKLSDMGISHTSHECRHTFRSELAAKGADRICMDRLMGHVSGNVGDDVYTHKTLDDLRKTIELIDY